ncbi:MAG: hypothetical protein NC178_07885, partial [Bacteroides sp.]|nr:hypothetical protein [Bacteroides sp.]
VPAAQPLGKEHLDNTEKNRPTALHNSQPYHISHHPHNSQIPPRVGEDADTPSPRPIRKYYIP